MRWRVEEYENACSAKSVRVVDERGEIIADNEPYYPEPLDPKYAHLIAAAPHLLDVLRAVQQQCLVDEDDGNIAVSEDVVIPSDLFDRICDAINAASQVQS